MFFKIQFIFSISARLNSIRNFGTEFNKKNYSIHKIIQLKKVQENSIKKIIQFKKIQDSSSI